MPVLIKSVTGEVLDNIKTNIEVIKFTESSFGYDDWFRIGIIEVFLQNFKKVVEITDLNKSRELGLTINKNKKFIDLEISY
jgi:hypothetical protein